MRRLTALFTALALLLALCGAACAEEMTSGDYLYTVNGDGTATITLYMGYESDLSVPAELDGHPVTEIGNGAFGGNYDLVSVAIPAGVKTIGRYTFDGCTALSGLTFPAGVAEAGPGIFNDCPALTVTVAADSYMEEYCIDNEIPYKAQ